MIQPKTAAVILHRLSKSERDNPAQRLANELIRLAELATTQGPGKRFDKANERLMELLFTLRDG